MLRALIFLRPDVVLCRFPAEDLVSVEPRASMWRCQGLCADHRELPTHITELTKPLRATLIARKWDDPRWSPPWRAQHCTPSFKAILTGGSLLCGSPPTKASTRTSSWANSRRKQSMQSSQTSCATQRPTPVSREDLPAVFIHLVFRSV